jgi:hypothetical protein
MTPNDIEILIHCHVSPTPHPRFECNKDVFDSLELNGLIEYHEHLIGVYVTTARGRAHINQLCSTPWPTQAWVDKNGEVIV